MSAASCSMCSISSIEIAAFIREFTEASWVA